MKVGMYYSNKDVRVEEMDVPTIGANDILLKVMACGICGSDIMEWYRIKRAPLVLGHELSGEIIVVGKNIKKLKKGDRIFSTHHVPCNECRYCTGANTILGCTNISDIDAASFHNMTAPSERLSSNFKRGCRVQ